MKIGGLPAQYALALTIVTGGIQLASCYVVAVSVDKHGRVPWFAGAFAVAATGCARRRHRDRAAPGRMAGSPSWCSG